MKLSKEILESNIKRLQEVKKNREFLIPDSFLSAINNRGQNGKQVLRGRKSTKRK